MWVLFLFWVLGIDPRVLCPWARSQILLLVRVREGLIKLLWLQICAHLPCLVLKFSGLWEVTKPQALREVIRQWVLPSVNEILSFMQMDTWNIQPAWIFRTKCLSPLESAMTRYHARNRYQDFKQQPNMLSPWSGTSQYPKWRENKLAFFINYLVCDILL